MPNKRENQAGSKERTERTLFTPGPWEVVGADKVALDEYGNMLDGVTVESADGGTAIAAIAGGLPLYEAQANARLIAAAPELLEVLESVKSHLDYIANETKRTWRGSDQALYEKVQAAIAKAEKGE